MSAYDKSIVFSFKEGDFNLVREPYFYIESKDDRVHEVIDGDRLDTIAFKYYGNSRLWYIIADANEITNPFEIEVGSKLIIPGIS